MLDRQRKIVQSTRVPVLRGNGEIVITRVFYRHPGFLKNTLSLRRCSTLGDQSDGKSGKTSRGGQFWHMPAISIASAYVGKR